MNITTLIVVAFLAAGGLFAYAHKTHQTVSQIAEKITGKHDASVTALQPGTLLTAAPAPPQPAPVTVNLHLAPSITPVPAPSAALATSAAPPNDQAAQTQVASAPAPIVALPSLPNGIDTPDEEGRVLLLDLPDDSQFKDIRLAIDEVAEALPFGSRQRGSCLANVMYANGFTVVQNNGNPWIAECLPVHQVLNRQSGQLEWAVDNSQPAIPKAMGCPLMLRTVAAATKYCASIKKSVANSGDAQFIPNKG